MVSEGLGLPCAFHRE
jgi:hypothetical protein